MIPGLEAAGVYGPTHLTILPTYRCTAECAQCCFESSPHLSGQIPIERILAYIDEAAASFPTLRLIVFSGGECFLLREDLDRAISRVRERGLSSRCVTNGYWASSPKAARERVAALAKAGLTELNISTGDDHQRFVPFERVALGAVESAKAGIRAIIAIEGHQEARFGQDRALAHPLIAEFLASADPARELLSVFSNVWIPFKTGAPITQDPSLHRTASPAAHDGCDNVLENLVITPHEKVSSCCGLTFEHIPEMKLGDAGAKTLKEHYAGQLDDFMKIWLRVEGPEAILAFAAARNPRVSFGRDLSHPCQACVEVFRNEEVAKTLKASFHEKVPEVLFRYKLLAELRGRAAAAPAGNPSRAPTIGYGA